MKESPVEIVHIPVSEWAAYRELRLSALREEPAAYSSTFKNNLAQPDCFWQDRLTEAASGHSYLLFARCQDRLVGMIGAIPDGSEPDTAVIISVFVVWDFRGRGIGKLLMDAILKDLKVGGFRKAILSVNAGGVPAVNLYRKSGFAITGQEMGQMGDGQMHTGYRMEKNLGD